MGAVTFSLATPLAHLTAPIAALAANPATAPVLVAVAETAGTEEERRTIEQAARYGLAALDHRDLG